MYWHKGKFLGIGLLKNVKLRSHWWEVKTQAIVWTARGLVSKMAIFYFSDLGVASTLRTAHWLGRTDCSWKLAYRANSDVNTNCIVTWQKSSSTVFDQKSDIFDRSEPLFPCFKAVPSNLQNTELSYLNRKGAFEVPPPDLLRQLLTAYLQLAYGYMPIVNLHELLGSFSRRLL
jgi:hypothetical protein